MADHVAVVTGGGRGIGAAIARRLGAEGLAVVIADPGAALDGTGTDPEPAQAVAESIIRTGGAAAPLAVDAGSPDGAAAIAVAAERLGTPAVLVHAAGNLRDRTIPNLAPEAWRSVLAVHLDAAFLCARALWRGLERCGQGRVVIVGGAAGLIGSFGQAAYAAAKAGQLGLVRVLALEGRRSGITANLLLPFAHTRMTESIPAATPELSAYLEHAPGARPDDVAPLVAWLCSEAGGRITGQVLGIRGGELTIWSQPRPVARVLAPSAWTGEALGSLTHPALAAQLTPLEGELDLLGGPPVPLEPHGPGYPGP
jgi:NAD(P)-dependent dehydrogenase (short-subunit alcohol dehydrogenase family)